MSNTVSTEGRIAASKALQLLEVFRNLNQDMPIGEAVSFLMIATGETRDGGGLSVTELGKRGGFALASASRYMRSLAHKNRLGEPGHELVYTVEHPLDGRSKVLRLSDDGRALLASIQAILEK